MLKFLFKRPGDKSAETPADGSPASAKADAAASTTAQRAAQAEQLKALGGDEAMAADFILQCDFSELRLAAAEFITSRAQLERVHGAIRNTDRRVAKLLQGRIDALRHHDAEVARGQACLDQAASLLADEKLTPNQVAELDRRWSVIAAPELTARFDELRSALGQRLEAQVSLQRAMIDRLASLRQLIGGALEGSGNTHASASDNADISQQTGASDGFGAALRRIAADQAAALAGPEHASLPRSLMTEMGTELARADAMLADLERGREALAARQAALDGWTAALEQAAAASAVPAAVVDADSTSEASADAPPADTVPAAEAPATAAPAPESPPLDADTLQRAWSRLPAAPAGPVADALQARFDALLARLPGRPRKERQPQKIGEKNSDRHADKSAQREGDKQSGQGARGAAPAQGRPRPVGGADPAFLDELAAMEAALEQGSLHSAAEHDKALKDSKGGKLSSAQADRLAHARAELKRLSDWARWGGNVSREELIKAVEQLSTQSLPMAELAKKVGSMRERWKALDTLSGAAPKSLWERFDAACTLAYAPAAAHFKQLSEERHANAARAQALIAEAAEQAKRVQRDGAEPDENAAAAAPIDWKQMAATVQRLRLAWSHLGAIDRKDKKRLDQEFTAALNILQKPLERQRKAEVGHREALIEQVAALDPSERGALDALRAAQEKWQELARALPLERKAEQALWHRFRAACDAVFARRKETAHAHDAERRAHQGAKEALSQRLEQAAADGVDAAAARKLLQDVAGEWQGIGPVPRAVENKVEQRHRAAMAAVQARIDEHKRAASIAQASALRDKLRLCQQLEAALAEGAQSGVDSADRAAWQARWDALPPLSTDYERVLKTRFGQALAVLDGASDRAAWLRTLEKNRPILLEEVLRQEIAAGIDSGSDFARDRLKLQVEVLQSSLKSGQKGAGQAGRFEQIAAMPALVDERTASRIERLFARVGKGEK